MALSPPRLRALVREAAGAPLSRLRQWQRLRTAVRVLPHGSTADAATTAGFADQAHLTRTARRLAGRTPGSLRSRPVRTPSPQSGALPTPAVPGSAHAGRGPENPDDVDPAIARRQRGSRPRRGAHGVRVTPDPTTVPPRHHHAGGGRLHP
ncbi:helix-turn-helix domain-containing protein [Streptoalloteichus tenebrarius]|uniref:helix-turn-helix domain-containing protein n=1 Tax=Streptoalloteichus tenebrarius (strain ATCC 17920 / DSM 40477 / JCM 4838 / CBS 697.72 / NBRC 16177 / NCIMB 11028 / NRRL B-12390 / A12253. 1 / ISP 5477) TaxID=1933 RepID=UPI0035572799